MTTIEFLTHLENLGIKNWVENDKLRYRSPPAPPLSRGF